MAESKQPSSTLTGLMLQLSWMVMDDGPKNSLSVTSGHRKEALM